MTGNYPKAPNQITPAFAFTVLRRALLECFGRRRFRKEEMAEVMAFFGTDPMECVYCGSQEVTRWDHLVPVNKGGETVLGNIVPACGACDDSKGAKHFEEWLFSNCKKSPKTRNVPDLEHRKQRIDEYVRKFKYVLTPLEERLTRQELAALEEIHKSLAALRERCEKLIDGYKKRTEGT